MDKRYAPGGGQPPAAASANEEEGTGQSQAGGQGGGDGPPEDYDRASFLRKGFNQNIIAGIVAFTGPGLFNALQGLGNAGGSDPQVAATMNATLYATFSIFGILSGSLFNLLGEYEQKCRVLCLDVLTRILRQEAPASL